MLLYFYNFKSIPWEDSEFINGREKRIRKKQKKKTEAKKVEFNHQ